MINLIPPEAEKVAKHEYILRVGGILAFLLSAVLLIFTIALVPTYVLISAQIDTSIQQTEDAGLDEEFKKADAEVVLTKAFIDHIRTKEQRVQPSVIIESITDAVPPGISLGLFVTKQNEKTGVIEKIDLQGIASTRELLAQFKSAVEEASLFVKAEVPIADLARDTNLPFTMSITLQK